MTASCVRPLMLLLAVAAFPSVLAHAASEELLELTLEVGEQRVIASEGVTSYSEGITGVVDVRLTKDGQSFVVVGLRPGRTSLLFMMSGGRQLQYRISVTDPNQTGPRIDAADSTSVKPRDNVRLDFYFVQLSESERSDIGVRWPAAFGGGTAGASFDLMSGSFTQATAVVTDQALPRLDLAQSRGWAKLLRQAAVITENGSEADFSGGGEINIPVQSALSVGVRQISFGSEIRVKPRYDRESGRIELAVHAQVSDLSSDEGTGIPGRVISNLDSVVNLELGQSVVLAGLTAQSESASRTGLPGLSQLPIIGPLFGHRDRQADHTQNLVFIVPTVVDAVSADAREHVLEALKLFDDYDGDLDDTRLRPVPAPAGPKRRPQAAQGAQKP
ncbi:MAG: pilus assembly protein N-terminal domain-containing protein [Polyangiales bacterium]